MNLIELLSNGNVGYYNKAIARQFGLNEAIILSELCGKYEYWKKEGKIFEDDYFFETQEMIEENTTLTPRQQRPAITTLEEVGIIESKLMGLPATKYFKINEDKLLQYVITRCDKMSQQDVTKCNISNKDNNKDYNNTLFNNKLLNIEKPKKKNLYEKCIDLIDEYTNDQKLHNALVKYLDVRLAMRDKPLYGVNQWKGLLNKLDECSGDKIKIVKQSLERGWATFIDLDNNKFDKFCEYGKVKSVKMSDEEREELERRAENGELESF